MSRKRKIWVVVSVAVALIVLIPLGLRWRAQWNLNAYRKKLIASGEKLTVEELSPKRDPKATNTALFLKLAPTLSSYMDLPSTAMLPIKPGVARVAWRQARCMERIDDKKPEIDAWPMIMDAVRTNQVTLSNLQALVDAGGIEFVQDYAQPELDEYTFLPPVKELVNAFSTSTMLALHEGRMQDAIDYLKSSCTISQLLAKDPLMMDQLVRDACMSIMAGGIWEALHAGGWTDEQLAQLQRQWEGQSVLGAAESSLALERAREPMLFQLAVTSPQDKPDIWNDLLVNARTGVRELFKTYPRYWGWRWIWSFQEEQRYLEFMQTMIQAMRDAQNRRSVLALLKDRNTDDVPIRLDASDFDLLGQEVGVTETFVAQTLRAQTVANIVATAIALERFHLAHNAYPAALSNLTPEFLKAVPMDCMDGHDLRYRLNPDGTYLLYSVGDDGVDNGGDARPKEGSSSSFWYYGRDLVWPRSATDEEVHAYEAEQNQPKARGKR